MKIVSTKRAAILVPWFCAVLSLAACQRKADVPAAAGFGDSPSAAVADLTGVWRLAKPVEQLLTLDGAVPPLLPEARQRYEAHHAAKAKGDLSWDPVQWCKPPGEPRSDMEMGWPFEIVQTPERVDVLFQWNRMHRVVPVLDHQTTFVGPFYYGQSVGKWRGKDFVVDLVGLNDDVYLDPSGLPHSDELHLTETFTLDGANTLRLRMRIEDPKVFASAWESQLEFTRQPAGSIVEDDCLVRMHMEKNYPVLPAAQYPQ